MARYVFTGGNGISGETGLIVKNGLNNNFSELYSASHTRIHSLTSALDHQAALAADRGKWLKADPTTGFPVWLSILESDIPSTIARTSALLAHTSNQANPHQTLLSHLAKAGKSIEFGGTLAMADIAVISKPDRGIKSDSTAGGLELDFINVSDTLLTPWTLDDLFIFYSPTTSSFYTITAQKLRAWVLATGGGMVDNSVILSDMITTAGRKVSAMVRGDGVRAVWETDTFLSITIDADCEILGINIQLPSATTMSLSLTYATPRSTPWYPIMQAWRSDTRDQLTAALVTGTSVENKFTISGLADAATNYIRLTF